MIIESVRVESFRCLAEATLNCSSLTALVGSNGAGKSSFLRALEIFYNPAARLAEDDFFAGDTTRPIIIAVTFAELTDAASELFAKYTQDGRLTVEKVIRWNEARPVASYHGATLQNPTFDQLRAAFQIKDRAVSAKAALATLQKDGIPDLPEWSTIAAVQEAIRGWEDTHPDLCERRRDAGQFFGFKQVGHGYLGRFTKLLYVPAVRDASGDASEGRASVFSELMNLVVRSVMATKSGIADLEAQIDDTYRELIAPANNPELNDLQTQLTDSLILFVPGAAVELDWLPTETLNLPMPNANVKLLEDGYAAPVDRCGHGLQRAFIVTMLQHLALARQVEMDAEDESDDGGGGDDHSSLLPNLFLMIEEPELYQHPSRQRHFAKILKSLALGETPGVAERTQVIYSTHSPLLVGIDRIGEIRLLRKTKVGDDLPRATEVITVNLDDVAKEIWTSSGRGGDPFTAETLLPRLAALMTPWMNEGFFARVVVLVEGEDDRTAILGTAMAMSHDFESVGVTVIPCHGKASLDRPTVIFRRLGIPVFVVWDGDRGAENARPEPNRRLLRLLGRDPVDWPSGVEADYACFPVNLEVTLRDEIGEQLFDDLLGDAQKRLGILKRKHALKTPDVIAHVVRQSAARGSTAPTLEAIVGRIVDLL